MLWRNFARAFLCHLSIVFVLFGVMNPAVAKLTPWMMELLAEELADAGMSVGQVTVDASSSWTQFFKNSFGITYGYNAYFWDNSVMSDLWEAILGWWLCGIFAMALMVFFSTIASSFTGVLLGVMAGVAISYVLSIIPKLAPYTPTSLMGATDGNMVKAVTVTLILSIALLASSVPLMNKKTL